MGKVLTDMYEEVKKYGGLNAQIKLSILTLIPSTKAATIPDSTETIRKFQEAINSIKLEFKK